ncbi:MAG: hypothetical protein HRU19_28160 [Pseudobacteriovorax sp.]|nr:hypothetical protein [Pseudobacteriovorax sp.]
MKSYFAITMLALSLMTPPAFAKGQTVNIEGRLDLGLDYQQARQTGTLYFDSRVKLKTKRADGFKAIIEVKGNSKNREARFDEAYLNYKLNEDDRILFGFRRKGLGLDILRGFQKRFFTKRHIASQYLETIAYNSVEPGLSLRRKHDEGSFAVSIFVPESKDSSFNFHKTWTFSQPGINLGIWGLIQQDTRFEAEKKVVGASQFAIWHEFSSGHQWDFEIGLGVDPLQSELSQLTDSGEIYYHSAILGYRLRFLEEKAAKKYHEIGIRIANLVKDSNQPTLSSQEASLGYAAFHNTISYHAGVFIIVDRNPILDDDLSYLRSEAQISIRKTL